MIITISGKAGTGKSTIGKLMAKKLGYNHYSMGDFQREIAAEMGLTIVELGELEKKDPSIDTMVDDRQRQKGLKEDNFVVDSWLGAFFIPNSYKVFLDCDLGVRAERLYHREPDQYKNVAEARQYIIQREETNRERWINYYGFDFLDMKRYDLIIDTTDKDIDTIANEIMVNLPKN